MERIQNGSGMTPEVEALMAEMTTRAWQDDKFRDDLKEDRAAVIKKLARELGVDLSNVSDLDLDVAPSPIGDAPFQREDETQHAGGTGGQWTCGYCPSVDGQDCGVLTAWDCYNFTWNQYCYSAYCPSVYFTCGAPNDPSC